jgi:hypothetical protein
MREGEQTKRTKKGTSMGYYTILVMRGAVALVAAAAHSWHI